MLQHSLTDGNSAVSPGQMQNMVAAVESILREVGEDPHRSVRPSCSPIHSQ